MFYNFKFQLSINRMKDKRKIGKCDLVFKLLVKYKNG